VTAGTYSESFDTTLASSFRPGFIASSGGTVAFAEAALFAGLAAGEAYFNIHTLNSTTGLYPGGEIRGFLRAEAVAEPATVALMLTGIGASCCCGADDWCADTQRHAKCALARLTNITKMFI